MFEVQHGIAGDTAQQPGPANWLAGFVPAGMYGSDGNVSHWAHKPTRREAYTSVLKRTIPVGMTERLRRLMTAEPSRSFSMRELADGLGIVGPRWELGSALCKLARRGLVVKKSDRVGDRLGLRYRWAQGRVGV